MAEFKVAEDLIPKALWLLQELANKHLNIVIGTNNKICIRADDATAAWLASHLLEIYTDAVSDTITG